RTLPGGTGFQPVCLCLHRLDSKHHGRLIAVRAGGVPMQAPCWTLNDATSGIGRTYPQHQSMGKEYDYGAPDSVHKFPFDGFAKFEPNFRTVIIHGHARLTDLLSSIIPNGYLVGPRLRALLEQFVLPPHRFYPVPMEHRNKPVPADSTSRLTSLVREWVVLADRFAFPDGDAI